MRWAPGHTTGRSPLTALHGVDSGRYCGVGPMGTLTLAMQTSGAFFPQFKGFWLPAVIGELKPNRCMGINSYRYPLPCTHRCKGINPLVSPPIHSDLRSPTAYATREMRYGHIPGSGACLDLPVPHSMSPVIYLLLYTS